MKVQREREGRDFEKKRKKKQKSKWKRQAARGAPYT